MQTARQDKNSLLESPFFDEFDNRRAKKLLKEIKKREKGKKFIHLKHKEHKNAIFCVEEQKYLNNNKRYAEFEVVTEKLNYYDK